MTLATVLKLLRQIAFLAAAKPTLFRAAAEGIAVAALAGIEGDAHTVYADVDALFKREVKIALDSLGLKQPPRVVTEGIPTP